MLGPREVVTLQLGHYAGSVGAHWWGLQEASFCFDSVDKQSEEGIRHDVLFRTGKTLQGQETYTPRLIVMDLKGSMSSLKQEGCLYQDPKTNTPVAWKGNLTTHQEEPSPKNRFLHGLDKSESGEAASRPLLRPEVVPSDVTASTGRFTKSDRSSNGDFVLRTPCGDRTLLLERHGEASKALNVERTMPVWSDFLRTHLHPRSILTIHQYNHDGESNRLEAFGQGEKLLQDAMCLEELEDRLHFYVEECDYLQGFQVLCDLHNGFSGLGAKVTELLQDEYTGKGILTWGLTPVLHTPNPHLGLYRLMNTVLGLVHLSSHSSLFCPLSLNGSLGLRLGSPIALPYVQYDASWDYHTSAILATALDTCTVPYRLQSSTLSMAHLAEALNFSGRKVATAAAAVPFPATPSQSLPDALCAHQSSMPWSPLSSCGEQRDSRCFAQSVVLRGIAKERLVSKPPPGCEPKSILHMCETGEEVLARYLYTTCPTTLSSTVHLLQGPCQLRAPYPQYFSPLLDKQGFLLDAPAGASATVESIPIITALQSSALLHRTLGLLHRELHQLDIRRWASFFAAGVELEDFQEALEDLRTLSHCYRERCSGSEEESEDEVD